MEKVWRAMFWDDAGLNLPAVTFTAAVTAALVLAIHTVIKTGEFDFLQYSFGVAVIFVGYGAAAASRLRTNARFRRLEQRVAALERTCIMPAHEPLREMDIGRQAITR